MSADLAALLAEAERLGTQVALADAMPKQVAMNTTAKELFPSRHQRGEMPDDERTHQRAAHRVLAADLTPQDKA